jgi:hypothetical protein
VAAALPGLLVQAFVAYTIASQWEILLTPMANMYVKFS